MENSKWVLDTTHSEIQFKVKHLMISTVTGQFNQFSGTVETNGDDFTNGKVHFTADVSSISTNNEQRDAHLKTVIFLMQKIIRNSFSKAVKLKKWVMTNINYMARLQ